MIKEYGERLVKNINAFIENENLHKYVDQRPSKRAKTTPSDFSKHMYMPPKKQEAGTPDEFDVDIDYSAIELPGQR